MFQRPTTYDQLPMSGHEATGCDFAYTSKAGDWTVFIQGVANAGVLYVKRVHRVQQDAVIWATALQGFPNPTAFIGGQEGGIASFLRTDYGINLVTHRASTDKLSRAQPAAAAWNRGDIRVPTSAPWLEEFLLELSSFTGGPNDDHDDQVDALASLHHALLGVPQARAGKRIL